VQLIKDEVERRGFIMPCGERKDEPQTNGARGSSGDRATTNGNGAMQNSVQAEEEEEGIYL